MSGARPQPALHGAGSKRICAVVFMNFNTSKDRKTDAVAYYLPHFVRSGWDFLLGIERGQYAVEFICSGADSLSRSQDIVAAEFGSVLANLTRSFVDRH